MQRHWSRDPAGPAREGSGTPALASVARIVRSTHERHDGDGYPDRLAGDQIPLEARIIAVCEAYEAMTSPRPYGRAVSHVEALAELARCAGTQFDPTVVEASARVFANAPPADRQPPPAEDAADTGSDRFRYALGLADAF